MPLIGSSSKELNMTFVHKLGSLQIGIADLSNSYASGTSSPYGLSNAVGNLSLSIGGTDSDEITLSRGRYVLYAVPYVTTTANVQFTWQSDESGSFANVGKIGKVPITGDGTGQNSSAVYAFDVTSSVKVRLRLTALGGSATDSGGYVRISRGDL